MTTCIQITTPKGVQMAAFCIAATAVRIVNLKNVTTLHATEIK